MKRLLLFATCIISASAQDELSAQLLGIKRVYVDRLTGAAAAEQMRDLLISSLQSARLFVLTENPDRADAILRGAAEDSIFTDVFQSAEGADLRSAIGSGSRSVRSGASAI